VVVVVGASSGIGRATALAYADLDADLVLAARGEELLDEVTARCRVRGTGTVLAHPTDVLDADAVEALFCVAQEAFGRIDVVVHAAMVMAYGRIEDLPTDVYAAVVDTALHGTAHVARSAIPRFRGQGEGTLVIVTSLLASVAVPGIGAYVAGKWGQFGLVRSLRLEVRDTPGIRVVTVAPGSVDTPIYERAANYEGRSGAPPPPVDTPEKVARAIVTAVANGRSRVSVGLLNIVVVAGFRLVGPLYGGLVGPLYRRFAHRRDELPPTDGNVFSGSRPLAVPGRDR
jgi:NAD(P)-dependent dehydrogenase (short-subunit alcohol dehydrogenase family)